MHYKISNSKEFENVWNDYLYQNLLGNEEIIKDILDTFAKKNEIGFIYPEIFYKTKKLPSISSKNKNIHLNYIINKIFPGNKAGIKFIYPLGNMFWARVDSIKQAFGHKYVYMLKKIDSEKDWKFTSHFNEIFWLYLVKMNRYLYKTIFNGI